MRNALLYSTEDSAYFAELIGKQLAVVPSKIIRFKFGDGELYHRLDIKDANEIFGKIAIFVGNTHGDKNFDELEKIGYTLAEYGAAKTIFVIPFFGYSTMERAVLPGEAISAKINARRLSNIPGKNIFLMLDLHTSVILHYFERGCLRYEISAKNILERAIAELNLKNIVFGTADLGKTKLTEIFAVEFKTDVVYICKSRVLSKTKVNNVIGDVAGKNVIIYDDMTRTGGTLIKAADAYLKNGAVKIYAVLSHLAVNDEAAIKKLEKSPITKIIITNSHPMSRNKLVKLSRKFIVKDVTGEFGEVIKKLV